MSEPASPYADPAFATRFAAFALACWFSHDGQWFLKTKEAFGLETAMALNERVAQATARIQARRIRELLGIGEVEDCRDLARLLPLVHSLFFLSRTDGGESLDPFLDAYSAVTGLAPGEARVLSVDAEHVEIGFSRCLLAEMAHASGTEAPPGTLPGCRGLRRWLAGCALGLSSRYDFVDEERPGEPGSGIVCRHEIRRVRRTG